MSLKNLDSFFSYLEKDMRGSKRPPLSHLRVNTTENLSELPVQTNANTECIQICPVKFTQIMHLHRDING